MRLRLGVSRGSRQNSTLHAQNAYHSDDQERLRLEREYAELLEEVPSLAQAVSYTGNRSVPLLRLYRYKEAFSFRLASEVLRTFRPAPDSLVLDPFCGMGTTLLAAAADGLASHGIDKLPVAAFIARTLPLFLTLESGQVTDALQQARSRLDSEAPAPCAADVPLVKRAFPPEVLRRLLQWKSAIAALDPPQRDVMTLLLMSCLEKCSLTSKDGQFLRLVPHKKVQWPDHALAAACEEAEADVARARILWPHRGWSVAVREGDATDLGSYPRDPVQTIVTSPPYPNRYDYTRTYALELCLFFVTNAAELSALRQSLLRSHIEAKSLPGDEPPHPAVAEALNHIQGQPLNNPRVPTMLLAYFVDMARVISLWGERVARGGQVAVVVDNVRFAGEVVPTDLILSELARQAGFDVTGILVCRYKGNSSQQMGRYGRVPVRESILLWRRA